MATTYKTFLNNDIATTRTLLHEAIPMTGTIVSGTYQLEGTEYNIKNYAHGMFQSVYDYPYLSSSANHVFDLTVGISSASYFSSSVNEYAVNQFSKKRNVYDQMAQVLVPYDISGNIRPFDQNGNLNEVGSTTDYKFHEAIFINFARLLTKDEIKKGTFSISFMTGGFVTGTMPDGREGLMTIQDHGAASSFKVNSPTGEYGLLYTGSADLGTESAVGHIYYQAGIAVLTASIFSSDWLSPGYDGMLGNLSTGYDSFSRCMFGPPQKCDDSGILPSGATGYNSGSYQAVLISGTIEDFSDGLRNRIVNIEFNNTTELNSTIYFCRANTGDFNYSSNPTYLSSSKIVVKGDNPFAQPVSYMTTIGLYSPNNELLAVAKLSEPLKKTPSNELTLRVRLDY